MCRISFLSKLARSTVLLALIGVLALSSSSALAGVHNPLDALMTPLAHPCADTGDLEPCPPALACLQACAALSVGALIPVAGVAPGVLPWSDRGIGFDLFLFRAGRSPAPEPFPPRRFSSF